MCSADHIWMCPVDSTSTVLKHPTHFKWSAIINYECSLNMGNRIKFIGFMFHVKFNVSSQETETGIFVANIYFTPDRL